jgi:hypothetical protein
MDEHGGVGNVAGDNQDIVLKLSQVTELVLVMEP